VAFLALLGLAALDAAGYSVIAPVVPAIARSTGAGPALVGALVTCFAVGQLAGYPIAGRGVRRRHAAFVLGVVAVPTLVGSLAPDAYTALGGWPGWLFLEGAVGWLLAAWALPAHLPPPLRRRVARWRAFRRHLRRFSSVRDAPAAALVIWGRYLEYAVALGIAGRVERQVRALSPWSRLPSPWPGAPHGLAGYRWATAFRRWAPTHRAPAGRPANRSP